MQPQAAGYKVYFLYDGQNTAGQNYDFAFLRNGAAVRNASRVSYVRSFRSEIRNLCSRKSDGPCPLGLPGVGWLCYGTLELCVVGDHVLPWLACSSLH